MENTQNDKDARTGNGIASVESTKSDAAKNEFGNFISHDSEAKADSPIADDPAERKEKQDQYFDDKENPGRDFNINDQAYSQSSKEDFVKTVSNYKHADDTSEASSDESK